MHMGVTRLNIATINNQVQDCIVSHAPRVLLVSLYNPEWQIPRLTFTSNKNLTSSVFAFRTFPRPRNLEHSAPSQEQYQLIGHFPT